MVTESAANAWTEHFLRACLGNRRVGYRATARQILRTSIGGICMPENVFRHELHEFAIELRRLAYTMPAGHEDRLIHLSERMAMRSRQSWQAAEIS